MITVREKGAIAKKQAAQREALWGKGVDKYLWNRLANKGFATIPKTMPLILQIMDSLSNGKPLSATYLGLWCSTWDNSMVNTSKHQELAHAAGFSGQRAVYTWASRIQLLAELKFIDIKAGKSGAISHVLIWNPHKAIKWHHDVNKTAGLEEAKYNALLDLALDVGANDMIEPIDPEPAVAAPPLSAAAAPTPEQAFGASAPSPATS